jgi:inner membrane protein
MLLFAHTGLTLGAAVIVAGSAKNYRLKSGNRGSWLTALSGYLDIRLLLIGSLLPDIIDKPLGLFFLRDSLGNGRIYTHTLLFFVLITAAGMLLYKLRHTTWMLVLSAGTLTHLLMDQMWLTPKTFFWPFLGLEFDRIEVTHWISNIFEGLRTYPQIYIPELIGFVVIIWFGFVLVFRKQMLDFIRHGKVRWSVQSG